MNLSLRRSSSFLLAALVTLSATACTFTSGLDEVQKEKDKARTFDTPPEEKAGAGGAGGGGPDPIAIGGAAGEGGSS